MNQLRIIGALFLLLSITSSCLETFGEPGEGHYFMFSFKNNSENNAHLRIYGHPTSWKNGKVERLVPYQYGSIPPSETRDLGLLYENGADDTWGSFFKAMDIDTLYIVVHKIDVDVRRSRPYDLSEDTTIVKIYKFSAENVNFAQTTAVIEYP